MRLEVHHLTVPRAGETANGDAVVSRTLPEGTLLAVIDALGHGEAAAETAQVAVEYLEGLASLPDVLSLMTTLHQRMAGTRGAAIFLCTFDRERLTGCSVGNVDVRSRLDPIPAILTPGVVGARLRNPRVFEATLREGERIALFTDGLSTRLRARDADGLFGLDACQSLMRMHRRPDDDATVALVDATR